MKDYKYDIAIIGGCGHVGLPLGILFADKNQRVLLLDSNTSIVESIKSGYFPYLEQDAQLYLDKVLNNGYLFCSDQRSMINKARSIIFTIGTPVDEFLNPDNKNLKKVFDEYLPFLRKGQLLVLRSTVTPGTTDWLADYVKDIGVDVAFCPERVVQGHMFSELLGMPQIVAGATKSAEIRATKMFKMLTKSIIYLTTKEAELAKLFSNAYRYINFAIANQFYIIAESAGLDYHNIHKVMTANYNRMSYMPLPGFAAGPCLFKDTAQLSAFASNEFSLGNVAMLINEGMPLYIIKKLKYLYQDNLKYMTIGLLGMSFKSEIDDIRSSLSYKLKNSLVMLVKHIKTTDPYVTIDKDLEPLDVVLEKSDVLIICTPHKIYNSLKNERDRIIDIWGIIDSSV